MQIQDIPVVSPWLLPKLQQRWPESTERGFQGRLLSYISSNHTCIICTRNAVGVAQEISDLRDPIQVVELIWITHNEGFLEDGLNVVRELVEWGWRRGAKEFRFTREGDIAIENLRGAIGARKSRTTHYVEA
jgi:hypothetical protein